MILSGVHVLVLFSRVESRYAAAMSTSIPQAEPPEIAAFSDALQLLDAGTFQIRSSDIERVEAFWIMPDTDADSAGFVLRLWDGSRAYLSYFYNFAGDDPPTSVAIEMIRNGLTRPVIYNTRDPAYDMDEDAYHLNEELVLHCRDSDAIPDAPRSRDQSSDARN
jgi:hypothetical protein